MIDSDSKISYNGADHMRKLRKEKGYSQEVVSEILDVNRMTYVNWESGRVPIPAGKAHELAKEYDCSIDYLLGVSNYRNIDAAAVAEITGLSDSAIGTLKISKPAGIVARTVSNLLDDYQKHGADSVLYLIKSFLSTREGEKIETKPTAGFKAPVPPVSYSVDLSAALLLSLNSSMDRFRREYWGDVPNKAE